MADFPDLKLATDQRDHVVRSHTFGLVHEQDTVRSLWKRHSYKFSSFRAKSRNPVAKNVKVIPQDPSTPLRFAQDDGRGYASTLSHTSFKTRSSTSGSVPRTRAPAASVWPPPPNFWQIAQTSMASVFERMLTRTLPSANSSKKTATITPRTARR